MADCNSISDPTDMHNFNAYFNNGYMRFQIRKNVVSKMQQLRKPNQHFFFKSISNKNIHKQTPIEYTPNIIIYFIYIIIIICYIFNIIIYFNYEIALFYFDNSKY